MLKQLSIKNYALIDDLKVTFGDGFTTITGETGAGKSILLGALSLVLGKRADLSSLKNKEQKCVIEAEFEVDGYQLQSFFQANDLDYGSQAFFRREILPSGKSRAFINDTPVNLDVMSSLGDRLVDIHSQHQTLELTDHDFQLKVLDAMAGNQSLLVTYQAELKALKESQKQLEALLDFQSRSAKELDYNSFLLQELEDARLRTGLQAELEEEQEQLSNVGAIIEHLGTGHQLLQDDNIGILSQLQELKTVIGRLVPFGKKYESLAERIASVLIELQDVSTDLERLSDDVEPDPERLEQVDGQLQLVHNLLKKHQASDIDELLIIKAALDEKVGESINVSAKIDLAQKKVSQLQSQVGQLAKQLHQNREKVIPELSQVLEERLSPLGMAAARFNLSLLPTPEFRPYGNEELQLLFSANRGGDFGPLKKVASGGELSRIMLVIKSILSSYDQLPTLMFDEIDTGVSGEVSEKMGEIMKQMGQHMQIFAITHLPQVAAQGQEQFKVFKEEAGDTTRTQMKKLNRESRIQELSSMLGGKTISDAAIAQAKILLDQG